MEIDFKYIVDNCKTIGDVVKLDYELRKIRVQMEERKDRS